MPALNGGYNFVGICFPNEGAWLPLMLADETVDCGLQVDDGLKHAVLRPRRVSFAKMPSTALSHEQDVGTK